MKPRRITFDDLSGGLNLSAPADAIRETELATADNMEYAADGTGLTVRPGLTRIAVLDEPITGLAVMDDDTLIAVSQTGIHRVNNGAAVKIGAPTGTRSPVFARYAGEIIIATGGTLQSTDGTTVSTIPISGTLNHADAGISNVNVDVNPDTVLVRHGRLMVAASGHDMLFFSAAGDPGSWDFDVDAASAKFIEVGYKDGADITCITELAGDIIVMKSGGDVYRVGGFYPEWSVSRIAATAPALSPRSAMTAYGDCFIATTDGVTSLSAVAAYGDFAVTAPGRALGRSFAAGSDDGAALMRITGRDQLWLRTRRFDSSCWVYHPAMGVWTRFTFPAPLGAAASTDTETFVGIGGVICRFDDGAPDDDGSPRRATLAPKTVPASRRGFVVTEAAARFIPLSTGEAALDVAGHGVPVDFMDAADDAATDTDDAATDDDPLTGGVTTTVTARLNRRTDALAPTLAIERGRLALTALSFTATEV